MTEFDYVRELFKRAEDNPQETFKDVKMAALLHRSEKSHSILIERPDTGDAGLYFAALVDVGKDGTQKRWWISSEYLPDNWPAMSICLLHRTDDEMRQDIMRWAQPAWIIRDNAELFAKPDAE